jgi:molybdopterin converting factor small subunit
MMPLEVKLFARARDLAGAGVVRLAPPLPATVGELRRRLAEECPPLAGLLGRCAIAVDHELATDDRPLAGGEVAIIPPVSGG